MSHPVIEIPEKHQKRYEAFRKNIEHCNMSYEDLTKYAFRYMIAATEALASKEELLAELNCFKNPEASH